jgi:hypothetical protein
MYQQTIYGTPKNPFYEYPDLQIELKFYFYSRSQYSPFLLVEAVAAAFQAFVEFAMNLIQAAVDWIWDWIKSMFEAIIEPIILALEGYVKNIARAFGPVETYITEASTRCRTPNDEMTKGIQRAWDALQIVILTITTILLVLESIEIIVYPFIGAGAVALSTLVDFIKPIILSIVAGAILFGVFAIVEDTKDKKAAEASEIDNVFPVAYSSIAFTSAVWTYIGTKLLIIPKGLADAAYGCTLALLGLILSFIGTNVQTGIRLLALDIWGACLSIGGLILAVKSTLWTVGRLVPKVENAVTVAAAIGTFATIYSHIETGKY